MSCSRGPSWWLAASMYGSMTRSVYVACGRLPGAVSRGRGIENLLDYGAGPGQLCPRSSSLAPLLVMARRNSGQAESGVEGAEGRDRVPGCFRYPGGNRMNTGEVDERRI